MLVVNEHRRTVVKNIVNPQNMKQSKYQSV